jgi:hypothetical protein
VEHIPTSRAPAKITTLNLYISLSLISSLAETPVIARYALLAARSMRRKGLLNNTGLWNVLAAWSSHPERLRVQGVIPMKKYLIAGALIAGFVTPALAEQFYVAFDPASHKCTMMHS